jgi:outer membrane protein assembly factor BamD (BamD/ComL family)
MTNKKKRIVSSRGIVLILICVLIAGAAISSQTIFRNDITYYLAVQEFKKGNYQDVRPKFVALGEFKDSSSYVIEVDYQEAILLYEDKQYTESLVVFNRLNLYKNSQNYIKDCLYQLAITEFNDQKYVEAKDSFELLGYYKDSHEYYQESTYVLALVLFNEEQYLEAKAAFAKLSDYKNSLDYYLQSGYALALIYLEAGDLTHAKEAFAELGDYKDSVVQFDALDIQELMLIAPEFPSTTREIRKVEGINKVYYIAKAINPYKAKTGEVVGIYKREVTFEGVEVGGIALTPNAVVRLMINAGIEVMFIPADLSEINNRDVISVSLEDMTRHSVVYLDVWVKIDFQDNLVSLSNPYYNTQYTNTYPINDPTVFGPEVTNGLSVLADDLLLYDCSIIGDMDLGEPFTGINPFGVRLAMIDHIMGLLLNFNGKTEEQMKTVTFDPDRMLRVGSALVFMMDTD